MALGALAVSRRSSRSPGRVAARKLVPRWHSSRQIGVHAAHCGGTHVQRCRTVQESTMAVRRRDIMPVGPLSAQQHASRCPGGVVDHRYVPLQRGSSGVTWPNRIPRYFTLEHMGSAPLGHVLAHHHAYLQVTAPQRYPLACLCATGPPTCVVMPPWCLLVGGACAPLIATSMAGSPLRPLLPPERYMQVTGH